MENLETQRLIIRELEIKDAMRLSEYRDKGKLLSINHGGGTLTRKP